MHAYLHTLATAITLGALAKSSSSPTARTVPTRNECLATLAASGYTGPTSYTARDLRPLAAWNSVFVHLTGRSLAGGREGGMTRTDCLVALRDLGWAGPTSYTARDLRWLVAAVYAELAD